MDKLCTLTEAIAPIKDGMTVGIGGWGARRKPMALVRELLRSDIKNLTIVSYGGPDVGLLCASNKIKKLVFGFVSLDVIPLEAHFRKARQSGALQITELDEGMLQWGLRAAAMRMPFLPTRAGLGTDIMDKNPDFQIVHSPYADKEAFLAMPALNLDVALLHANHADSRGNSAVTGPDPFFDELFARAAKHVVVSSDELMPTKHFNNADYARNNMKFERSLVHAVVHTPYGAHPTSSAPDYGIDVAHLKEYSATATDEALWMSYYNTYIEADETSYLKAVGGEETIKKLSLPIF